MNDEIIKNLAQSYANANVRIEQLERENAELRKTLVDADVLYQYGRDDGRREWANFATYIRKNEIVVLIDRAAFYAARKEAKP